MNNFVDFADEKGTDISIAKRYNTDEWANLSYSDIKTTLTLLENYLELYPDDSLIQEIVKNDNVFYSDEYTTCDECGVIFKYPSIDYNYYKEGHLDLEEGSCFCTTCIREDPDSYLETLINNPNNICLLFEVSELKKMGWQQLSPLQENGCYGKQDSPETEFKIYSKQYPNMDILFVRTNSNPFMVQWIIMGKEREDN